MVVVTSAGSEEIKTGHANRTLHIFTGSFPKQNTLKNDFKIF